MTHVSKYVLLSAAYLGPVQYYTKFLQYDKVFVEAQENYQKQSYRNRCLILSANGILPLIIPVAKDQPKVITKDIRIDNTLSWQKNHWNAIESAYSASPYFEFFIDDLIPFYKKHYTYLLDFNLELQNMMLEVLEIKISVSITDHFIKHPASETDDFRHAIHPKKSTNKHDRYFHPAFYYQVFQDKYGFIPNLSILDLLLNEGSNAENILRQSIVR